MSLSMEVFENMANHIDVAMFLADKEGNIIYANDYLIKHTIMTKAELLSSNCNHMFQHGVTNKNVFQEVKQKKAAVIALQTLTQNVAGTQRTLEYIVKQKPIMDEVGQVAYVVGVVCSSEEYAIISAEAQRIFAQAHRTYPSPKAPSVLPATLPVYASKKMEELYHQAEILAASDATILILGESGVGKEVLASYLHRKSPRAGREMVAINCAALNENLLESELFGYEKGSFTGASSTGKKGLVELANGSTLFLDEIDSLPLVLQSKILRLLETHEIRPIGGSRTIKVDFRVIAATNANLEERVANRQFREDLYYRINVLPITIPPLRNRKEDISALAQYFLSRFNQKYNRQLSLAAYAQEQLSTYAWPGNVRELRNLIERLVLITDISVHEIKEIAGSLFRSQEAETEKTSPLGLSASTSDSGHLQKGVSLKEQSAAYENLLIEEAIQTYGSLSKAANALGITKNTLIRKRKR